MFNDDISGMYDAYSCKKKNQSYCGQRLHMHYHELESALLNSQIILTLVRRRNLMIVIRLLAQTTKIT